MSKKHFEALAIALRDARPVVSYSSNTDGFEHGRYQQWSRDVLAICDMCAELSERFDRLKFIKKVYENSAATS